MASLLRFGALMFALWSQLAFGQTDHTIGSAPTCGTCRIVLDSGVVLTLPDSLAFSVGTGVARVVNGYLAWDVADDSWRLEYFNSSGAFQATVGRRGQGPGEFEEILRVSVGPRDTINVIENFRRHVLTSDRRYVRTEVIPGGSSDLLVLGADESILAAVVQTPDRFGYPLHFIDGRGDILQSFGAVDLTIDPRAVQASHGNVKSMISRRLVRGAQPGTFWAYNGNGFLLQEYDTTGRLLANVVHTRDGWYADASRRNAVQGEDKGLGPAVVVASRDPSVLWLIYNDRQRAATGVWFDVADNITALDVVIEAIDTRTFAVLATTRLPKNWALPVVNGPDQLRFVRMLNSDEHTYRLVTMRLVR